VEALELECTLLASPSPNSGSVSPVLQIPVDSASTIGTLSLSEVEAAHHPQCKGQRHTLPHLLPLNMPLFIATDANQHATHPLLMRFHCTFPCTFYLSDFAADVAPLKHLQNKADGLKLNELLFPFVDAMVVAQASMFAGLQPSTRLGHAAVVLVWERKVSSGAAVVLGLVWFAFYREYFISSGLLPPSVAAFSCISGVCPFAFFVVVLLMSLCRGRKVEWGIAGCSDGV
jgi:hypothetical protein